MAACRYQCPIDPLSAETTYQTFVAAAAHVVEVERDPLRLRASVWICSLPSLQFKILILNQNSMFIAPIEIYI